ncbi:MAG TPA: metallophosphoesterase [Polyangiales bacterium]|nr:metallophosphoesterase [Polyangiales bacterium]
MAAAVIVLALHVYLWRRLVRDLALPARLHRFGTALIALLGTIVVAAVGVSLLVARNGYPLLTALGFGWLGTTVYLIALLVAGDVLRFATRKRSPRSATGPDALREPRRVFVARAVAGSALLASGGIAAFGVRSAVWELHTPHVPVRLTRLPRALDNFSIALLSDVHIGPMLDGRFLRQLVDRTNALRPDLIAIAGDLVDGSVREIGAQVAELGRLHAPHGVFFVTGNHEYYSGARQWIQFLPRLGVRVLMNEHVPIGDAAASFDLAGVTDRMGARWRHGPDALAATRGRDTQRELVMLAHQPVQIFDSAAVGAGLQLSGHTHGGQLQPFGELARLRQPYVAGLHRHEPGGAQIYVSCGTGFWGPPLRVLAPAEIPLIRLVAG